MADIYKTAYLRDKYVPIDQANLNIASSPMLYGLSTYTVMPVFWDKNKKQLNMFRLADHFKRLQNSSRILAFDDFIKNWDKAKFEKIIIDLLVDNEVQSDALVRITIFVDGILSGTKMIGIPHELAIFVYPRTILLPAAGANLTVSSWRRITDNAIPPRAKVNGSYVNSALMKNDALLLGFDDAIALDDQGHVTESTLSNIFIIRDGKLLTPSAATDLLEGLTRDTIFKLAKDLGLECHEKTIDRSELYLAEEAFLCGSSVSITPILSIDHRNIGNKKAGPITKKLMVAYYEVTHGRSKDKYHWISTVS